MTRLLPPFDWVGDYLVRQNGWDSTAARLAVRECRLFLTVCAQSEEPQTPPTVQCDEAWHAFILHTREYAEFCDKHIGRFVHHEPLVSAHEVPDSSRTRAAMQLLDPSWSPMGEEGCRCKTPRDPLCRQPAAEV